jgi:hypothetical protein
MDGEETKELQANQLAAHFDILPEEFAKTCSTSDPLMVAQSKHKTRCNICEHSIKEIKLHTSVSFPLAVGRDSILVRLISCFQNS